MSDPKEVPKGRIGNIVIPLPEQNLSGKGWQSGDFKGNSFGDTPFTTSLAATTINAPNTDFLSPEDRQAIAAVLKDPRQAAAAEGPTYAASNRYSPADIAKGMGQRGAVGMTPASQASTAEGQKQIGSFLGRVFDYTDESDNVGEYVFDRMIQGLVWTWDKVAEAEVARSSSLPFTGMGDITNETVTPGQSGITATGQAARNIAEFFGGDEDLASMIAPLYSGLLNPMGALSRADAQYSQPGFDINDPEQQKQAFVEDLGGRLASGATDAVFTVVADPTLYVGKAASIAKLRYLDDIFQGPEGIARMRTQFTNSLGKPIDQKAGFARFIAKTVETDPATGAKLMSAGQIATRLRGATQAETMAAALHASKDEEISQLIAMHVFGDIEAGKQLLEKQPSIFLPIARKQREEVMALLDRSPEKRKILEKNATDAEAKLTAAMANAKPGSARYALLERKRELARDTYNAITNGKLGDLEDMSNPIMKGLLSKEFNETIKNDSIIANALTDAQMEVRIGGSALAGARRGFARDNVVGRAVEKSRLRRSNAAYEAAAARGEMRGTGKMIDLGDGKFVEEMKKNWIPLQFNADGFRRTINIWRWVGEQNPSGFVFTKGAAAAGSWKEVQAVVNDVDIYSGAARKVTWTESVKNRKTGLMEDVQRTAFVGGRERKDQLLTDYMSAMKQTAAGADATQVALEKIEQEIIKDIGQWHGLTVDATKDIARQMNKGRSEVLTSISETKGKGSPAFWVENGETNTSAWLETHIQNGTYMLNYRALNKHLDRMNADGSLSKFQSAVETGGAWTSSAYDAFNSVWRPSVLLRLGYTQRNVLEGLFRASAFTFSLDPVRQAAATGGYSTVNAFRKKGFLRAVDSAEAAMRLRAAGDPSAMLPRNYRKWLESQIDAREKNIIEIESFIEQPGRIIADLSKESKQFMLNFYKGQQSRYVDRLARAKAAGAGADEIKLLEDCITTAQQNISDVSAINKYMLSDYYSEVAKINRKRSWTLAQKREAIAQLDSANSELVSTANRVLDDIGSSVGLLDDALTRRKMLDNDMSALAEYMRSGGAKLRVHNGTIIAPDNTVLNAAFSNRSSYTSTALSNLSADATTRAVSRSASNTMLNAMRVHRLVNYTNVSPTDATYMDGVATSLRQIKSSSVGEMVIQGKTVREVADYLYSNPEGRDILEFIVNGHNSEVSRKVAAAKKAAAASGKKPADPSGKFVTVDKDEALKRAQDLVDRYHQIAPSADLREYMKGVVADDSFDGKVVNVFLGEKDAAGNYVMNLQPVVGNMLETFGVNSFRNTVNNFTSAGMKWLGTIPEDAFVRAPFYGTRYEQTLREMIESLQGQIGKDGVISWKQYENMMREAHSRALKDTKEWMFTIERRTNLGTYGEVAIPFISAMQNSVTTIGRLIWNDPAVAVLMVKLWQSPEKMGIMDDNGTLHFPIPHALLPDEFEKQLGIENQGEIKFNISQFNLVAPQLDHGILFQFGPVAAIPVGFLMQKQLLGFSVDTPSILKGILPDGMADSLWGTFKTMNWGPNGIPPTDINEAFTDLTPPWFKRLVSVLSGEGNAAWDKIYMGNMLTEIMKKRGGLRDEYPTEDELSTMTRNHLILKGLSNLTVAFPPGYDSVLQPLIDDYRRMQENELTAGDADMRFSQKYGDDFLIAKDLGMTQGIVQPVSGMVEIATRHEDLIREVSNELADAGDLTVLSMMFGQNSDAVFDGSIYAWQMGNEVPGLSQRWRERQTSNEMLVNDQKNAGWNKWSKALSQFDARLAGLALHSYDYAPQLKLEKDTFLANMGQDPMYAAWFRDYKEFGSSRTSSTITFMKAALSDPKWIEDNRDSPVWQAAKQYLDGREVVLAKLAERGGEITSLKNRHIKDWWDSYRSDLKMIDGWDAMANRFLDGDDNPQNPGVLSLTTMTGDK